MLAELSRATASAPGSNRFSPSAAGPPARNGPLAVLDLTCGRSGRSDRSCPHCRCLPDVGPRRGHAQVAAEIWTDPRDTRLFSGHLGMGKLGGPRAEFQFRNRSDIPLREDPGHQAAYRCCRRRVGLHSVTRAISELTADGWFFRTISTSGREARRGPGPSLDSARSITCSSASPGAHGPAQGPARGRRLRGRPPFTGGPQPFIFRRHLDYTANEELKALKARFTRKVGQGRQHSG